MVQGYLGIKTPQKQIAKSESENTDQDLHEFVQFFTAAGGSIG